MPEIRWTDVSYQGLPQNSEGYSALQEAVNNIINTTPGERLFTPWFGCDLENLLFEPIDTITATRIRVKMIACIQDSDPRIRVDRSQSTVQASPDDNRYDVKLVLQILGVGQPGVFSFSLERWVD